MVLVRGAFLVGPLLDAAREVHVAACIGLYLRTHARFEATDVLCEEGPIRVADFGQGHISHVAFEFRDAFDGVRRCGAGDIVRVECQAVNISEHFVLAR